MLFDIAELIEHVSHRMPLEPGDVIATGTPAGVAAMHKPDGLAAAGRHRDSRGGRPGPARQPGAYGSAVP